MQKRTANNNYLGVSFTIFSIVFFCPKEYLYGHRLIGFNPGNSCMAWSQGPWGRRPLGSWKISENLVNKLLTWLDGSVFCFLSSNFDNWADIVSWPIFNFCMDLTDSQCGSRAWQTKVWRRQNKATTGARKLWRHKSKRINRVYQRRCWPKRPSDRRMSWVHIRASRKQTQMWMTSICRILSLLNTQNQTVHLLVWLKHFVFVSLQFTPFVCSKLQ